MHARRTSNSLFQRTGCAEGEGRRKKEKGKRECAAFFPSSFFLLPPTPYPYAMSMLDLAAVLITLTALAGFANQRWFKLPATIGVTLIALAMALGLLLLERLGFVFAAGLSDAIKKIDFNATLMD